MKKITLLKSKNSQSSVASGDTPPKNEAPFCTQKIYDDCFRNCHGILFIDYWEKKFLQVYLIHRHRKVLFYHGNAFAQYSSVLIAKLKRLVFEFARHPSTLQIWHLRITTRSPIRKNYWQEGHFILTRMQFRKRMQTLRCSTNFIIDPIVNHTELST